MKTKTEAQRRAAMKRDLMRAREILSNYSSEITQAIEGATEGSWKSLTHVQHALMHLTEES